MVKKWMSRAGSLSDGGLGGEGRLCWVGRRWPESWRLGLGREAATPREAPVASEMLQTARRQA